MTSIHDILLSRPISDNLARFLMFSIFTVHLFFVLIMIGTAITGLYYFLHAWWSGEGYELRWDKHIHKTFLGPKAMGVVLGVGVLLVIQLYFGLPFYTATTLFGPYWLLVILAMVFSFLMIDGISHTEEVHPWVSFFLGVIGVAIFLMVPATFVTILVAMENSDKWISISERNFHFDSQLLIHWLMRFTHIIGAGIVFGAAFQYFFTTGEHDYRKHSLMRWIIGGMLVQFLIGGLLAMTLQQWIDKWTLLPLAVGIAGAGIFIWGMYNHAATHDAGTAPVLGSTAYLLPIILVGMLLTRQFIQQQKVLPLLSQAQANAAAYRKVVNEYVPQSLAGFSGKLMTVYDNGPTIFNNSCSFCHGLDGSGNSPESAGLLIPPERISQSRASREWIYNILVNGYPGTGMPYFSVFDKYKLEDLMDHLNDRFGIFEATQNLPVTIKDQEWEAAQREFNTTCAQCHGLDGRGVTAYSKPLVPSPPDFTRYNLTPARAFEVIRDGYPGTAMKSFEPLPEKVRWGLVRKVNAFRGNPK